MLFDAGAFVLGFLLVVGAAFVALHNLLYAQDRPPLSRPTNLMLASSAGLCWVVLVGGWAVTVCGGVAIFPTGLLAAVLAGAFLSGLSERFALWLVLPGVGGIRGPVDCSKARAAEAREDYAAAERLYTAELTGMPKEDCPVCLHLGNLYRKLGRFDDAAVAWEGAICGGLPPELHRATTLRLVDLCLQKLDQPQRARQALETGIAGGLNPREGDILTTRLARLQQRRRQRVTPLAPLPGIPLLVPAGHPAVDGIPRAS